MPRDVLLHVGPGDRVQIVLDHYCPPRSFEATVEWVERRYGSRINPLLHYRDASVDVGGPDCCDQGFVTAVLSRSSGVYSRKTNIYLQDQRRFAEVVESVSGGGLRGSFMGLLVWGLSRLQIDVDRPLDLKRARLVYGRTLLGFRGADPQFLFIMTVNKRRWLRWVGVNWTRCVVTAGEQTRCRDAEERRFEEQYWRDVEREEMAWD